MKKAYICCISFFMFIILFTGCYYFSYQAALKEFNSNSVEKKKELFIQAKGSNIEDESSMLVDAVKEDIVTPDTNYTLEIYNLKDNTFKEDNLTTPEFLIGLNREDIIKYLTEYMKEVPIEEFENGLVSFELISLSKSDVVLRKTYNIDNVPYQYYIVLQKGYITVLYSDKKTVYEYTEIEAAHLPEEERNKLIDGINVKTEEELYGILENYSS